MARLARSLETLRSEVNAWAPRRSKVSDGWIGDAAHRSRPSRHNENRYGVVTALDLTHDPRGGCDIHALARRLVRNPHPELEYVISNGQVAKRRNGFRWERYTGSNAHTLHAHFAVGRGPDSDPLPPYDSPQPWGVSPALTGDDDMTPEQAKQLGAVHALATQTNNNVATLTEIVARMADDVPPNLKAELDELRRNLRTVAAQVGVPADQIER